MLIKHRLPAMKELFLLDDEYLLGKFFHQAGDDQLVELTEDLVKDKLKAQGYDPLPIISIMSSATFNVLPRWDTHTGFEHIR